MYASGHETVWYSMEIVNMYKVSIIKYKNTNNQKNVKKGKEILSFLKLCLTTETHDYLGQTF